MILENAIERAAGDRIGLLREKLAIMENALDIVTIRFNFLKGGYQRLFNKHQELKERNRRLEEELKFYNIPLP